MVLLAAWGIGQIAWWPPAAFPYGPQITYQAGRFAQHLRHLDFEALKAHIAGYTYYPPLYDVTLGFAHAILGFRWVNPVLLNFIYVALTAVGLFLLVRRLADDFGALIAVALFLGHEMVFCLARIPLREVAVTTAVVWALWLLHDSRLLWKRGAALAFAAVYAAGLLFKWTYPVFTLVPAVVVIAARLLTEDRDRRRVWLNLALLLVVGFALCAPWYLGVLDLRYLFTSTANDPTQLELPLRLRFYPEVLGMAAFGGERAFYVLLVAAVVGLLSSARNGIVLGIALGGALFFQKIIPHYEERYILPLLPSLLALVGLACRRVPAHGWLRGPLLALVVGASAWSFVALTFVLPRQAGDSGAITPLPSASCLADGRRALEGVIAEAVRLSRPGRPTALATHPFNRNTRFFSIDSLPLLLWQDRQTDLVRHIGFDFVYYHRFVARFQEADLLVVQDNVWNAPPQEIEFNMRAWRDFVEIEREVKTDLPPYPQMRAEIESRFDRVATYESVCFPAVHLYVRREARQDTSASTAQE
jgi:hypothetical protein